MKKILPTTFLIALFLSSCASKPVKLVNAPAPDQMEKIRHAVAGTGEAKLETPSEKLAKAYLEALYDEKSGHIGEACKQFEKLSDKGQFPLQDSALVHALKNCDYSKGELEDIWAEKKVSSYLKEFFFDISRQLAAKNKMEDYEAEFSFALIPYKQVAKERISLISRAIEIAQTKGDLSKLKLYKEKLVELSPLHAEEITPQNIYSVARDFETNRNFDRARELYEQIIKGDFTLEEKIKAFNSYRMSYKVARNLKIFLEKTYEMEKFLRAEMEKANDEKTDQAWVEAKITLVRAVWTDHRNNEARDLLNELIESKKGSENQQALAQYLYGSLYLESKENKQALKRFEKAANFKVTNSSLLENIQWAIVWNSWLLKEDFKIQQSVEQFAKKSNNQAFVAKLTFWKAKSLQRMGKNEEAKDIFTALNATDPFGYYGLLSSIEADISLKPLLPSPISKETSGNLTLDWLIALEEKEFSQKLLKEINSQFKKNDEREKAMSLYYFTEWYQGGMRQIYNFKQSAKNMMTEKYINVVFPTPYLSSVEKIANKYSVPQELVYAITRQESAFVASERSWADAFGLMQMIPEKAEELSKKYHIPYKDFNDLYHPEINIEMGTALLKDLRKKFNSKFAQTVAAYNASESAIKVWEKERFHGNYLEFIEMIPYEETRNYIKLVFRNYITYKRISAKEEFKLDSNFFEKPFN